MEKYNDKVNKVNDDPEFEPFLTPEENYQFTLNTERSIGRKEGQSSIIEKLMKKGMTKEEVSRTIDIPLEEIDRLLNV